MPNGPAPPVTSFYGKIGEPTLAPRQFHLELRVREKVKDGCWHRQVEY